jgi:sodium transport system permease protein
MRFKFPKLKWIFLSIGAYIASYIVMIIVMMFIVAFFPDSLDQIQGLNKVLDFGNVGLEILIIGLLPAICEEVLFRGFIFSSFIKKVKGEPSEKDKITRIVKIKEKYGKCRFETQIIDNRQRKNALFAMILSGFLFGGMHIYPIKILPVSILGITFAYVVYKSGSIFTSMMLHFINNAMSVFFMNIFPTTSILYKTALITRIDNIEMIRIVIFVVIVVLVLEKFIKNRLNLSEIL